MSPFPTHDEAAVRDRFRGALLGLAAGEALGEPADFLTAEQIEERFGVITEMIGGGCHDVAPGETTDENPWPRKCAATSSPFSSGRWT